MVEVILNYLRSDYLENFTERELLKLEVEAEYFQLSRLQLIIKELLSVVEDQNSNPSADEVNVKKKVKLWR